ncbi:hypothetical protein QZH41_008855, partial [Actinostola sp. cb2023]
CHAAVGYQGNGKQSCYLSGSCAGKKGKVLHEMMHILDFLHEQCRSDRDNYITIHKDNIKPGTEDNFKIFPGKDLGIPYDCDSILHYKGTAFAKSPSSVTISSSRCSKLGNDDTRLSLLDYKRVNTLYRCNPNPNWTIPSVKWRIETIWYDYWDINPYGSHGSGPGWYPTKFIVTDPVNGNERTFTNNKELHPSSTYGEKNFPLHEASTP